MYATESKVDTMKHLKKWFFIVLALGMTIPCLLWWTCSDRQPMPDEVVIVDDWSKPLNEGGYKPATVTKPDHIPGDKLPETVEAVLYAEGSTSEHEVEISVVTSPDDVVWIKAVIDGDVVKWRKVEYMTQPKPTRNDNWSLLVASEWLNSPDIGLGIAYEPLQFQGARIGLQAVFDLNSDLTDSPDWITPALRISRRIGAFSVGGYCGYRIGEQQGLGLGVNVGIAIGI